MREETGVAVAPGEVLGVLDDYATRSGYLMTPVVVWGGPVSQAMNGPASEVAQIYVVPLADFDVAPRLLRIPESPRPVLQLPLLGRWVNTPTAAIVYQFCQVALHGNLIRVAALRAARVRLEVDGRLKVASSAGRALRLLLIPCTNHYGASAYPAARRRRRHPGEGCHDGQQTVGGRLRRGADPVPAARGRGSERPRAAVHAAG